MENDWARWNFHDQTLLRFALDWASGELDIGISVWPSRSVSIVATKLSRPVIPREFPWGASVSIRNAGLVDFPRPGLKKLEILTQSGDLIEVIAEQIVPIARDS